MVVSLMTFTLVLMQRWVNLGFVIHSFFYFKLHCDMSSAMTRAIWQALNPQDWCRFKLKCLLYSSDSMRCAIICSVKIMASCSQLSSHSVEPAAVQINRRMFCLGNPLEKRPRTSVGAALKKVLQLMIARVSWAQSVSHRIMDAS